MPAIYAIVTYVNILKVILGAILIKNGIWAKNIVDDIRQE